MNLNPFFLLSFLTFLFSGILNASPTNNNGIDVLNYHVFLEPDLNKKEVKGCVLIKFKADRKNDKVIFDSGNLKVTNFKGKGVKGFEQKENKVFISLDKNTANEYEVELFYEGKPEKGIVFLSSPQQIYTVYYTSEWMICNTSPDDRASLKIDLLVPNQFRAIASGNLINKQTQGDNKTLYSWNQDYETPTYTYGFAMGSFHEYKDQYHDISLNYYSHKHTSQELELIFKNTEDMLSFFELKSGVQYPQGSYTQLIMGNHYQEMSGFAVLKESYGELVLTDSSEANLISHELAHQWWGNMVTCKSWNHFWLNEGFATFMSAAYNEHRFGRKKYQENIDAYFNVYDKIRKKGADKPLVFPDWTNPTKDDRNLVYFKGAYVLHLLRKELGDEPFWKGIKFFTQKFYEKSVTTEDFQYAMEKSSKRDLKAFFNIWIY
ncbi:M1 family metallopeptidase [Xanthovirga aplysinae]|uniref:M1 family metallopeptidase n=1 Tax=Xanthovirga aplysinae TaxID=2529853 RepID=UPI0012BB7348|nr:M1 family metallopeptidase [Xanthovirga aplysinae]MTI32660.1 aminopeptidase [Xanthovirga aplysinae]